MNISAKTEYACIAVLELVRNANGSEPIRIKDIADSHGIPSRFLVQILLQLKSAGIVRSIRGAAGGYRLAMKPEEISLFQVMNVIEGNQEIRSNLKELTPISKVLNSVWNSLLESNIKELENISFSDLMEQVRAQPENMYYI